MTPLDLDTLAELLADRVERLLRQRLPAIVGACGDKCTDHTQKKPEADDVGESSMLEAKVASLLYSKPKPRRVRPSSKRKSSSRSKGSG